MQTLPKPRRREQGPVTQRPSPETFRIHRLRREELPVDTIEMARYLIGRTLVHDLPSGRLSGRIVETEAYPSGDASGRAFPGETRSNRSLFLGRGHAFVYFIYGCWFMMNVSSERAGVGAAVLLRALEPLDGIQRMKLRNGSVPGRNVTSGPGRLARAMRIDRRCDGVDLCAAGALWLGTAVRPAGLIGDSVRIGITREVEHLRRFFEVGSPYVSGPKRLRVFHPNGVTEPSLRT